MNLGEITEAAIAQVVALRHTNFVDVNEEFVRAMVNKGYHIIERAALWKFSEAEEDVTAQAGERVCADIPEDFALSVAAYSYKNKVELFYHDERQRFWDLNDSGDVLAYGVWQGEVRWYPLPKREETIRLRYYAKWPDLVDDEDVPVIPETWHDLLLDYASGQLALRLPPEGDRFLPNSRAEPYMQSFEARLNEMMQSDLVMKTWDTVPNYAFQDNVLDLGEW